jgi:hypothetical protein
MDITFGELWELDSYHFEFSLIFYNFARVDMLLFCYFCCSHYATLIGFKQILLDRWGSKLSRTYLYAKFESIQLWKN